MPKTFSWLQTWELHSHLTREFIKFSVLWALLIRTFFIAFVKQTTELFTISFLDFKEILNFNFHLNFQKQSCQNLNSYHNFSTSLFSNSRMYLQSNLLQKLVSFTKNICIILKLNSFSLFKSISYETYLFFLFYLPFDANSQKKPFSAELSIRMSKNA